MHTAGSLTYPQQDEPWEPAAREPLVRRAQVLLPERQAAVDAAVYDRTALKIADTFDGPAIVEQDDTTTLLTPGWRARVDDLGNLVLERSSN